MRTIGEFLPLPDRQFRFHSLNDVAQHLEGRTAGCTAHCDGKGDVADCKSPVPMCGGNRYLRMGSRDVTYDPLHRIRRVRMHLVLKCNHDSAVIVVSHDSEELCNRALLFAGHMATQNIQINDVFGHKREWTMHIVSLASECSVLIPTGSLRNQVRNHRQQGFESFSDRIHRTRQIDDQGIAVEARQTTADDRHLR